MYSAADSDSPLSGSACAGPGRGDSNLEPGGWAPVAGVVLAPNPFSDSVPRKKEQVLEGNVQGGDLGGSYTGREFYGGRTSTRSLRKNYDF